MVEPLTGAELTRRAIALEPAPAIPFWAPNIMDTALLECLAERPPGSYAEDDGGTFVEAMVRCGVSCVNQVVRGQHRQTEAWRETHRGRAAQAWTAETAAADIAERVLPSLRGALSRFDAAEVGDWFAAECRHGQALLPPEILYIPYAGAFRMPTLKYGTYGYEPFLQAFALFPELMETMFELEGRLGAHYNTAVAECIVANGLPRCVRFDHDMTDQRGSMIDPRVLDRIFFPELERCVAPFAKRGIRVVWHSDGNIEPFVPRLLEIGVDGFQGFQYECGVDYPRICRTKARDGRPLMIWAGVSSATTLAHGTPQQVRDELRWLVDEGPSVGLMLGASSSILQNTPRQNVLALVEGARHYAGIEQDLAVAIP